MSFAVGIVVHPTRLVDGSAHSILGWAREQGVPAELRPPQA